MSAALRWIESTGGPLVVVPLSALDQWHGAPAEFDPDDLDTWGDYGRACTVAGVAGTLPVKDAEVLVLADEPLATTFQPGSMMFLRGTAIPPPTDADWQDLGVWVTDGPALLFDAAFTADEATDTVELRVTAGAYRLLAAGDAIRLIPVT